MSKKHKVSQVQVPAQYQDLRLLKKEHVGRKVVIDLSGKFHEYQSAESPIGPEIQVEREFRSYDEFEAQPAQQVLAYHEQFFHCEPPPRQSKSTTALYCWAWILQNAEPHLDAVSGKNSEGRASTILERQYRPGVKWGESSPITTRQASVCLTIFRDALGDKKSLSERELRDEVVRRAPELHTKQDPWRIFQYYRPQLIAAGMLCHD